MSLDGIIGMSPCPDKLQEYVFSYQLTKKEYFGQVQTLEYNLESINSTTNDGMGGHIAVNEMNNSAASFHNMLIIPYIHLYPVFSAVGISNTISHPNAG